MGCAGSSKRFECDTLVTLQSPPSPTKTVTLKTTSSVTKRAYMGKSLHTILEVRSYLEVSDNFE
jgi:hypothetical protein